MRSSLAASSSVPIAGPWQNISRGIPADDPLWQCERRIELSTRGPDGDLTGIGSSAWLGDTNTVGLIVDTTPTTDQLHRYLFRLCAIEIPFASGLVLHGFRQLLTIAATVTGSQSDQPCKRLFELDVTSPFWHFPNGNVSWHIVFQQARSSNAVFDPVPEAAGESVGLDNGLGSALLYIPPRVVYAPPAAGTIPGQAVGDLGTMYDIRTLWQSDGPDTRGGMGIFVRGPGKLVFYASVFQPNDTVCRPSDGSFDAFAALGMAKEDAFAMGFPGARYHRIAGSLFVELFPCCEATGRGGPIAGMPRQR